jgi:hypothetical protein
VGSPATGRTCSYIKKCHHKVFTPGKG